MARSADRGLAWTVHAYTASGAVLALLAVVAIVAGDYRGAFLLMFATVVIDATDGWLARRTRAAEVVPGLDGRRLDDIVDYLTFVFVPAVLLLESGRLPEGWGIGVASAMLLASAYGFARIDAKSADHYFTGFPSYWNIVAFYVYVLDLAPLANAVAVLVLCALVFVPIGYLYPSRTPVLRPVTIGLGVAWAAIVLIVVLRMPSLSTELAVASLAYPIYYVALSLWLHRRRGSDPTTPGT